MEVVGGEAASDAGVTDAPLTEQIPHGVREDPGGVQDDEVTLFTSLQDN